MIRLIRKLLGLCEHDWEEDFSGKLGEHKKLPGKCWETVTVGTFKNFYCKKCLKVKRLEWRS